MVVMVTTQKRFHQFYHFGEKDRPNTLPSLKLLEQRVHELVGGPLNPPLDNVVGNKRLRTERVKFICLRVLYLQIRL